MADIYQGAYCNITATGAADGHGGLFHDRNVHLVERCTVQARWPDSSLEELTEKPKWKGWENGLYEIRSDEFWSFELQRAPLILRSWVLQERYLAPRVIHFGARQILWECLEFDACDTHPEGLPFEYTARRF